MRAMAMQNVLNSKNAVRRHFRHGRYPPGLSRRRLEGWMFSQPCWSELAPKDRYRTAPMERGTAEMSARYFCKLRRPGTPLEGLLPTSAYGFNAREVGAPKASVMLSGGSSQCFVWYCNTYYLLSGKPIDTACNEQGDHFSNGGSAS
jgi:hypothetical protein